MNTINKEILGNNMRRYRIYIDTSFIGGCFDIEFEKWSNILFNEFLAGKKIAVVSDVMLEELSKAPNWISDKIKELSSDNYELVYQNSEAIELAQKYIDSKAIPGKCREDALHIALATVNNVDLLVSWNFKHIVNFDRILKYNSVNIVNGYKIVEIRSPKEVISYED